MKNQSKGRVIQLLSPIGLTRMSCANCYSFAEWYGKVIVESCPVCGSANPDLTRMRHWVNGNPDYSENLLKKRA